MKYKTLLPLLLILFTASLFAGSSLELVEKTGLTGGIIYIPSATDPDAAVEFAEKTEFIVFAQTADLKTALEIRNKAALKNVLSQKLYADSAPLNYLPVAPLSATIVLADNVTKAQATEENLSSWLDAVTPVRGVAIISGQVSGTLDALLKKRTEFTSEKSDGCLLVKRKALPGTDTWSQKFHDASNVRSSLDGTVKAPFLPAWYALPTNLGYWGDTMVTGGGRCYYIWANRAANASVSMICFDLRNGAKLWEKFFKWDKPRDRNRGGYYPGRSCMIAYEDDIWFIDEDAVRCFEGETGKDKTEIKGPEPDGQIKWIGEENGIIAVLAGDADSFSTSSLQQHAKNPFGSDVAAYDIKTGKQLWAETEANQIDERELAIRAGKIYYHVLNTRVVCRDLKTGKVEWEQKDGEILKLLAAKKEGSLHAMLISCRVLAATDKALYFASTIIKNRVALDISSGKLLWSEPVHEKPGRSLPDVLHGDNIYRSSNKQKWGGAKYVLHTNEKLSDKRAPGSGCGPSWAGPDYIVTAFGGIYKVDGPLIRAADLKSACEIGTVISDGVGFNAAGICRCALEIHGFRSFTWNEELKTEASPEALQLGPAVSAKPGAKSSDTDWSAHRGNNSRSGATAVSVADTAPASAWTWNPETKSEVVIPKTGYGARYLDVPEYLPSQIISVNGVGYFSDHQGIVRAVDLKDGKEKWNYPVGSRVMVSAAYAQGRIVIGSMDGFVTCLDAATGQLAWKYRVPPVERRIMWYGHLVSSWPLCGGVLVQDGQVFAVAGFQSHYGVHAVSLDLFTGKTLWSKHVPANAQKPDQSIGAMGTLTAAGGKIFFPTGGPVPASLDMKTGKETVVPPVRFAGPGRRGKDMAALSDDWVIYGGARTYADFNRWVINDRGLGFSICKTDMTLEKGKMVCLGAAFAEPSLMLPVFDDELIIGGSEYPPHKGNAVLQAWNKKAILDKTAAFDKPGGAKAKFLNKRSPYCFNTLLKDKQPVPEGGLWKDITTPVFTAVLCKNGLLAVHPKGGNKKNLTDWELSLLDRATGKMIWTTALPGRPAWNGLSVAADGSILVALWDGSVICLK